MSRYKIEPRPVFWKEPKRQVTNSGNANGVKFEVLSICDLPETSQKPDLEEMLLKFKGGKSRFLGGRKTW